ncbi:sporulation-delaying protein SdpB family protein [Streptomyces sp. NPDC092307]|uniref:sporulation-delaying protein SdpB family protein n=1 Tax=Streptomyces sp. NPDC092307 TaxID=3366013 RepID=UPI00382A47DD
MERLAATLVSRAPWTNVYGSARTLLALGTLGTLLASHSSSLFRPSHGVDGFPNCSGVASAGLFCNVPSDRLEWARWFGVMVLAVVASGWRPRVTALPHWWVSFSFYAEATAPDGGDQITSVLTLLLIPVALTDRRRWHWEPQREQRADRGRQALVAWSAMTVVRVQMAGVYFQACVSKLSHTEWANGTALYYWLRDSSFGAPHWIRPVLDPVMATPWGTQAVTWGALIVEGALFFGLFARYRARPYLLAAGISLHFSIGLLMGLWSFAMAMFAGLILFLRPPDHPWDLSRNKSPARSHWPETSPGDPERPLPQQCHRDLSEAMNKGDQD